MKRSAGKPTTRMFLVLAALSLLILASASPVRAVLPPGANESLAANAPVIVIGKVSALKKIADREVAVFKILTVGRGEIKEGTAVQVMPDRPPKKKLVGPAVKYHRFALGQTWLLFLQPPPPGYEKKMPYHTLAAHGWYTVKLDGIPDTAALLALLPKATNAGMEASLSFLREVYKGVGGWIEQGRN